jgi:hypothetical protein
MEYLQKCPDCGWVRSEEWSSCPNCELKKQQELIHKEELGSKMAWDEYDIPIATF